MPEILTEELAFGRYRYGYGTDGAQVRKLIWINDSANLLTNGDFSDGTTGWLTTGTVNSFTVVGGRGQLDATIGWVYQAFATEIGATYRSSGNLGIASGAPGFYAARKSDDMPPATNIVNLFATSTGDFQADFVATAVLTYFCMQNNGGGVIDFTNLSVIRL